VLLGVLAWHGLRAEAEAHAGREVPVDQGAVRRLKMVVERMAKGVATAARPMRAVIDGYLDLCAAELSRLEDRRDPDLWERAADVWDRRHQPYPAAYSRLRQAEASFARRSRRQAAITALRQAYATAKAMGARPFAAEIATVAARARVSLQEDGSPASVVAVEPVEVEPVEVEPVEVRPVRDELTALTVRELEVLAAVAEGLTNREIGNRLFISERTVGVHVGHIFDKLQVRSRVQASRVFLRSGRQADHVGATVTRS
jgi:DNA-binding CsgD family transcriptional regulator